MSHFVSSSREKGRKGPVEEREIEVYEGKMQSRGIAKNLWRWSLLIAFQPRHSISYKIVCAPSIYLKKAWMFG